VEHPRRRGLTLAEQVPSGIGVPGIVIGPVLMLCSLEFVGRAGDRGWRMAELLTPIAYVAWSLWLVATGIGLLV
jgi:hypothetical protein